MVRDRFPANTKAARLIMVAGAVLHFALSWKLFGRRGFPEVDPIWLSMIWLWVPAVPISAVFVKPSGKRARDLLVYALATGFSVSWGTIFRVPSHKTAVKAAVDLIFFAPLMIVGVGIVELLSQLM